MRNRIKPLSIAYLVCLLAYIGWFYLWPGLEDFLLRLSRSDFPMTPTIVLSKEFIPVFRFVDIFFLVGIGLYSFSYRAIHADLWEFAYLASLIFYSHDWIIAPAVQYLTMPEFISFAPMINYFILLAPKLLVPVFLYRYARKSKSIWEGPAETA